MAPRQKTGFDEKLAANGMNAMLYVLKNPFPDVPGTDSVLKARGKNYFKYERPLLILFLLVLFVLIVGVFSLSANQKQNIVAKDSSALALDKSDPTPVSKTLLKDNPKNLAYKGDEEYLALNRYERFHRTVKKPVGTHRQKVRATVVTGDKSLALAGKGFDFKGLEPQSRAGRYGDFTRRLLRPLPKMEPVPEDHLDLKLNQAKSSKDLIFHPSRRALGKYNRQKIYFKDQKPEEKKPQVLEDIPATKLLLLEADNSSLILRRSGESLDLLGGNEKINRKKYSRW